MMRSFALTLSAVTLRLYLPFSTFVLGIEFVVAYRAIAWLCWLPNLLVAEWLMKARPSALVRDDVSPDFKRSE